MNIKYLGQYDQQQSWTTRFNSNRQFSIQLRLVDIIIKDGKRFKIIKKLNMNANSFTFEISKDSQQVIFLTFECQVIIMENFNIKKRFKLPLRFSRTLKYIDKQQFLAVSTYSQIILFNHVNCNKKFKVFKDLDTHYIRLLEISVNQMIIMIAKKIVILDMELNNEFEGIFMFQSDQYFHFLDEKNEIIVSDETYITVFRIDYQNKIIFKHKTMLMESQNSQIWQILIAKELLLIQLQFKNNFLIYKYQNDLKLVYDLQNLPYPILVGCKYSSGCHIIYFEQGKNNNYILLFESLHNSYRNKVMPKVKLYRVSIRLEDEKQ